MSILGLIIELFVSGLGAVSDLFARMGYWLIAVILVLVAAGVLYYAIGG